MRHLALLGAVDHSAGPTRARAIRQPRQAPVDVAGPPRRRGVHRAADQLGDLRRSNSARSAAGTDTVFTRFAMTSSLADHNPRTQQLQLRTTSEVRPLPDGAHASPPWSWPIDRDTGDGRRAACLTPVANRRSTLVTAMPADVASGVMPPRGLQAGAGVRSRAASASAMRGRVVTTLSGLRLMESMPCSTRNAANSG